MLTADAYATWCARLGLSTEARALIDHVRTAPPSRRVRAAARNVAGRFPSRKMGVTIQFESHHVELPAIYLMEHDPEVLEFYDQPPSIKLKYRGGRGRSLGVIHTADFFILRSDGAGWEEWKQKEELVRLAERMPGRYVRQDDGWHCSPGKEYAEVFGLFYRVRSSAEIDWTFQRNLRLLGDYFERDPSTVPTESAQAIVMRVAAAPGVTLAELLTGPGAVSADHLYVLIAVGQVYVDLHRAPLAEPAQVVVFRDEATAEAYRVMTAARSASAVGPPPTLELAGGARIAWDGQPWQIANVGDHLTTLIGATGRVVQLKNGALEALVRDGAVTGLPTTETELHADVRRRLGQASPEDLREASRRYAIVAPSLAGDRVVGETPLRTLRQWVARYRHAEQAYGAGFVGLLPRHAERGNRHRKLPPRSLALMDEFIETRYETLAHKSIMAVHAELVRACDANGTIVPSYKTFATEVRRRPRATQVARRAGPRAAYRHEPRYLELELRTPRHGDRPFEIGHLDHTEVDLELVCAQTGQNLGRPWLTLLMDAYSRRVLAVAVTFDPPSYRSIMMAIRECVRRHARLPEVLVVDGGKEFDSVYFEALLARYECVKKTRPPAKARFGSVCERLFGTTNTRFVHTLIGNTQVMTNVRQVTKAVAPQTQACWTLDRFLARTCEWAYEVYDQIEHPTLGVTPRTAFVSGLSQLGERTHRRIPYDEEFRMFTLPTTRKGTAKVDTRLGLKINYLHYWSDNFRDPEVEARRVPVRYDPFDAGTAYAFVKGRWVHCVSEHHALFNGRSERELMLATEELRSRHRGHGRRLTITARQLGEFLGSLDAEERLLPQRRRDAAMRGALQVVQGGQIGEGASTPIIVASSIPSVPAEPRSTVLPAGRGATSGGAEDLTPYDDYR